MSNIKIMSSIRKLTEIKKQIEEAKTGRDRADGALQSLKAALENDFDCDNEKDAMNKLKQMKNRMNIMDKDIQERIEQLEKDYDWD